MYDNMPEYDFKAVYMFPCGWRLDTIVTDTVSRDASRARLLCLTNLQQVGEGVMVRLALSLKAIWSWEMPPYKYILLNCFSCLATVRPVLTFDPPRHVSLLPILTPKNSHMCSYSMQCSQTHVVNVEHKIILQMLAAQVIWL